MLDEPVKCWCWCCFGVLVLGCGRIGFEGGRAGSSDAGPSDAAIAAPKCGDGDLAPAEQCDDGNENDGDGCDADCTFTCDGDPACDDGALCNGAELCDLDRHKCVPGSPLEDGIECGADRVCRVGTCAPVSCGNGAIDPPEQCDDMNVDPGDGCEPDCTYTCSSDLECKDGEPCNGDEYCDLDRHKCFAGTPLADGVECASGRECMSGACTDVSPDAGAPDAGPRDGGSYDAGDDLTCVIDDDCAMGICCPTCGGFPDQCWPAVVCPVVKCFDGGGGSEM
jgi:cysteine-rich repeat protein